MACTLYQPAVRAVLDRLHAESEQVDPPLLAKAEGKGGAERAALLADAFIPVSRDAGQLLYALVRGAASGTVVEFGTSFAISTIYMAAALRDRGAGTLVTTEIYERKAERAREYLSEAGLLDIVELRIGDARETLQDLERDISVVFLDGMKSLYLPVLKLIEPALAPGALVVGDDLDLFPEPLQAYLAYVRDAANGYVSVTLPIGDTMELSVRA